MPQRPHAASDARLVAERLAYAPADGHPLFSDLDIAFGRERTGLIGPNGSGKTTLIRLLESALRTFDGAIVVVSHDAVLEAIGVERRLVL